MELKGLNIKLRLYKESDLNLMTYFFTDETEWMNHDAPWEKDDPFDAQKYYDSKLEKLFTKTEEQLSISRLEIFTKGLVHLGWVSSYPLNDLYEFDLSGTKRGIGIVIVYKEFRSRGFGYEALSLYMDFLKKYYPNELYIQTWSGNKAMINLALRLGFDEVNRIKDYREVNGKKYDALTFCYKFNKNHIN